MLKEEFNRSIRFRFLSVISLIFFIGTLLLSSVIALNEERVLKISLKTHGQSLASFIAKLSKDSLLIRDSIQLDAIVNDANKDEDIAYTVIHDEQGNLLTSQYASINYRSNRIISILSGLSRDSELQDIIDAIKKQGSVMEFSVPVMIDIKPVGKVTIGMSEHRIHQQITKTILFVIVLNLIVALVLGVVLFIASRKILLDPIAELARATSALAKGDLTARVNVKTTGEIKMLVDSFNQMLGDLEKVTVSRDYVDNIIKSMIDTLIVVSPDNRIVLANASACVLLGYEEKELIGNPVDSIFDNGLNISGLIMDEIISKGFLRNIETVYKTKGGDKVSMLFSGSVLPGKNKISGTVCVAKDITEIKKLEEELLRLHKLESIGVLAGGIAHDFNNLLQGLLGNISVAKRHLKPEDRAFAYIEQAENVRALAMNLTGQLLTFARGGEPIKSSVHIGEKIIEWVDFALSGSNLKTDFHIEDDCCLVEVDEGQVRQVVQNLVLNARDAMPLGGVLKVHAGQIYSGRGILLNEGMYMKISFKDEGGGIPEKYISRIFDPYFSTKNMGNQKGMGLGLAICHSIMKKHGGAITVESSEVIGSTFSICLPISKDLISGINRLEAEIRPAAHKGKVLVMDDEKIVTDTAEAYLNQIGYEAEIARDGDEAVAKYINAGRTDRPFNVVILDLTIPGGSGGKETLLRLLDIDPEVKAILSSGYSNDSIMTHYSQYGFLGVLTKPYTLEELDELMSSICGPF